MCIPLPLFGLGAAGGAAAAAGGAGAAAAGIGLAEIAAIGSAAAGIAGAVGQRKAAKESARLQEQAMQQAQKQAEDMAKASKAPPKAQGAKTPDLPAINAANVAANSRGNASTFLTGPSGVDPSSLNLGRNRLLGE